MIKNGAILLRLAVGLMAAGGAAFAQAPGRASSPAPAAPAPDAAFEAAKRAFEALPEAERRSIQENLIWTGDFNGVVGGAFGRNTRAAIVSFARRNNLPQDGALDERGRAALAAAGQAARANIGFSVTRDPRTGATLGLPTKILVKRVDSGAGSLWTAADNAVALETSQGRESERDLKTLFETLSASSPARKVTYKFMGPNFFVVTGEMSGRTFYTRIARGEVGGVGTLRGYTFSYPATAKGNDKVSIAIANAFDPFPAARPAAGVAATQGGAPAGQSSAPVAPPPPVARPTVVASGVAVGPDRIITALSRCADPKVGARAARVVKADDASGLMLLDAPGLGAKLLPMGAGAAADGVIVALYAAARAGVNNAAPPAEVMAATGELLASPARALAPLQGEAPGGAVFDRNGGFVGLVGAAKAPTRIAGVVPQTAWPVVEARKVTAFLEANGVRSEPAPGAGQTRSTADIAAAARASIYPVVCTVQ